MRIHVPLPHDPAVEAWFAARAGASGEAARWLAALIRENVPDARAALQHGIPKFCLPDGTVFCHVAALSRHTELAFVEGDRLADPDSLLEGTGKGIRYVKVSAPGAVDGTRLGRLVEAAAGRARKAA